MWRHPKWPIINHMTHYQNIMSQMKPNSKKLNMHYWKYHFHCEVHNSQRLSKIILILIKNCNRILACISCETFTSVGSCWDLYTSSFLAPFSAILMSNDFRTVDTFGVKIDISNIESMHIIQYIIRFFGMPYVKMVYIII